MGKFREGRDREQITFLPSSLDEYVSGDDPVRFLDVLIDELNLSAIEGQYSTMGRPAFSPVVLTKILLYGKIRGIRSCRELARAAKENVKFMFLAKDEKPDFRTINLFRKRFHQELSKLLGQTVRIALDEGMLKLEHVAIDGTKVKAYASKKSYKTPLELKELLSGIEKELESSFREDIEEDKDDNDDEPTLPPDLRGKKELREKVKKALSVYESMKEDVTKKTPKQVSVTDPECRYMPPKGIRGYNMQAAIDAKSRIVVGGYATNGSDNAELSPMIEEIEGNTDGKLPEELSADAGYCEIKTLRRLKEKGIVGFVGQRLPASTGFSIKRFAYRKKTDTYRCPNGRILHLKSYSSSTRFYKCETCCGCPLKSQCFLNKKSVNKKDACRTLSVSDYQPDVDEMIIRTRSPLGKEKRILRASTIETLFGYLKQAKNLSRFFVRGKEMINALWKLELTSINLMKIVQLRINQSLVPL